MIRIYILFGIAVLLAGVAGQSHATHTTNPCYIEGTVVSDTGSGILYADNAISFGVSETSPYDSVDFAVCNAADPSISETVTVMPSNVFTVISVVDGHTIDLTTESYYVQAHTVDSSGQTLVFDTICFSSEGFSRTLTACDNATHPVSINISSDQNSLNAKLDIQDKALTAPVALPIIETISAGVKDGHEIHFNLFISDMEDEDSLLTVNIVDVSPDHELPIISGTVEDYDPARTSYTVSPDHIVEFHIEPPIQGDTRIVFAANYTVADLEGNISQNKIELTAQPFEDPISYADRTYTIFQNQNLRLFYEAHLLPALYVTNSTWEDITFIELEEFAHDPIADPSLPADVFKYETERGNTIEIKQASDPVGRYNIMELNFTHAPDFIGTDTIYLLAWLPSTLSGLGSTFSDDGRISINVVEGICDTTVEHDLDFGLLYDGQISDVRTMNITNTGEMDAEVVLIAEPWVSIDSGDTVMDVEQTRYSVLEDNVSSYADRTPFTAAGVQLPSSEVGDMMNLAMQLQIDLLDPSFTGNIQQVINIGSSCT